MSKSVERKRGRKICKPFNIIIASSVIQKVGRGEIDRPKKQIVKGLIDHVRELGLDVQLNRQH